MDNNENQRDKVLSIDNDARINVLVNRPASDVTEIDLARVFHNMKLKSRIYAWVVLLCFVAGICASLLMYQFSQEPLTVTSVVTLKYDLVERDENGEILSVTPVADLTAPDLEPLNLNQVTSSYVLQNALDGLELSQPVTLANLRSNIRIERILTEDSRRQQEVASSMIEDNNNGAYTEVQNIELTYVNKFVVSLTNGFGDEDARGKYELTDAELRLVLDRILAAYNDYLYTTYADVKLPDDEISVIDTDSLDILESLDLLRTAVQNLYDFCDEKTDSIKEYRSWRTGYSLANLMEALQTARAVNVDYLYSYVYTNSIVKDRKSMITNYQYQLRNAQTQLDVINENIATTQEILDNYKNDEIFVSMQESDSSKATQTTTDYYNELILQQADNYDKAAELETRITDLSDKIASLDASSGADSGELASSDQAAAELENAIEVCHKAYTQISEQFEEITTSPLYTTYAEHSVAQGKSKSFLSASMKNMIVGGVVGAIIACGLWFLSALAPEFRSKKEEDAQEKEADK